MVRLWCKYSTRFAFLLALAASSCGNCELIPSSSSGLQFRSSRISSVSQKKRGTDEFTLPKQPRTLLTAAGFWPQSTPSSASGKSYGRSKTVSFEKRTLSDFQTVDSRVGFIRKVYAIFAGQCTATIIISAILMKNPSLVAAILQNFQVVSMSSACLSI